MKTFKYPIILDEDDIFVFGSNTQGRHGKGSAKFAKDNCGAIYGQAKGLQGKSYAIVTKDLTKKTHPSISKSYIIFQIQMLYEFAKLHSDKNFIVAYSGIGIINLNGYSNVEMAEMFSSCEIPDNIVFEENFVKLFKENYNKSI